MSSVDAAQVRADYDVSRETIALLDRYVQLLQKWSPKINLVSPKTLESIWTRHVADSLQLLDHVPAETRRWVDLGSGAGLPGLVAAIASREQDLWKTTLIESDKRKSVFISSVIQKLNLNAEVVASRIETVPAQKADVISARALAPLPKLMTFAEMHRAKSGVCLFPKGASASEELTAAQQGWHMEAESFPSRTDPDARIIVIGDFSRV